MRCRCGSSRRLVTLRTDVPSSFSDRTQVQWLNSYPGKVSLFKISSWPSASLKFRPRAPSGGEMTRLRTLSLKKGGVLSAAVSARVRGASMGAGTVGAVLWARGTRCGGGRECMLPGAVLPRTPNRGGQAGMTPCVRPTGAPASLPTHRAPPLLSVWPAHAAHPHGARTKQGENKLFFSKKTGPK